MTEQTKQTNNTEENLVGLKLLRSAFDDSQISKLPKPTKKQTDEVKADWSKGIKCKICGAFHHPNVVHLDYVGHAALTNRLLDCDPYWTWEFFAIGADGNPVIDKDGGFWIKLTVCGVTRLGYGDGGGKTGGDAMKERIGDALRNAAMRFGAALDLWFKGDEPLYLGDEGDEGDEGQAEKKAAAKKSRNKPVEEIKISEEDFKNLNALLDEAGADKIKFCEAYGIDSVKDLPLIKFAEATKALREKMRRAANQPQPKV